MRVLVLSADGYKLINIGEGEIGGTGPISAAPHLKIVPRLRVTFGQPSVKVLESNRRSQLRLVKNELAPGKKIS